MDSLLPPEAEARRRAAHGLLHGALCLLLLEAALAPALARALAPRGPLVLPPPLVVDLATDPAPRLALLPGIGMRRAQALLEHRALHGPPRRADDLLAVPGFGPARVRALREATEVRVVCFGRPLAPPR